MSDTALQITDSVLLEKLRASAIGDGQKKELEELFPQMSAEEKGELLNIINRSAEETQKYDANYQEKLGELNKEYAKKMTDLSKESNRHANKEFEKLDRQQTSAGLKVVEGEIATADFSPPRVGGARGGTNGKVGGHTGRTLFFLLFFLVLLAGAALYGLNYLTKT